MTWKFSSDFFFFSPKIIKLSELIINAEYCFLSGFVKINDVGCEHANAPSRKQHRGSPDVTFVFLLAILTAARQP